MSILQLLAEAAGITTSQPTEPIPWYANPQDMVLVLIVAMFMYFIFSSSRTKKKEQKLRDDMLKNLKRGDRVVTAGGILGTVVDARDADVMLKVDESSNSKIKFTRDAIKRVLTDDEATSTK
ncbi:MAG TPA: preprotein translocase subunit YajC [Tepidisphaeraceae bacterium]|nr:preprotein translocase subunit YajC [Tepidisphaeraceae bacterium]